jgi:hypothetical protein
VDDRIPRPWVLLVFLFRCCGFFCFSAQKGGRFVPQWGTSPISRDGRVLCVEGLYLRFFSLLSPILGSVYKFRKNSLYGRSILTTMLAMLVRYRNGVVLVR